MSLSIHNESPSSTFEAPILDFSDEKTPKEFNFKIESDPEECSMTKQLDSANCIELTLDDDPSKEQACLGLFFAV